MPERHGPTVGVDDVARDPEVVDGCQSDGGKGLVELEQVHVADRQARLLECLEGDRDGWVMRQVSGPATIP